MITAVLLFIAGLILLIKGGDWFVDGATGIAHRFNLPELLIGATVVSIGTTLPEVMVSATSAVGGHSEIAYGNAIGSIICNTALIAAITIAVRPGKVARKSLTMPICFFFFSAVFYAATAYISGSFSRVTGILLLLIFVIYMVCTVYSMTHEKPDAEKEAEHQKGKTNEKKKTNQKEETDQKDETNQKETSLGKEVTLLIIGAAIIAVGADLLVDNGTLIAQALGVPESVIALTLVALGTSLPELVTAITSLIKGHSALSLGNIIGANLFNLVLVCGVSVTLNPLEIPVNSVIFGQNASLVLDIPVMFLVMLILVVPAFVKQKLYRVQGIALLIIYFSYCTIQFMM